MYVPALGGLVLSLSATVTAPVQSATIELGDVLVA